MCRWNVEQWRDGECVRRLVLTGDMVQCCGDSVVITFPPHELAGGLVIATDDELRLYRCGD